MQTFYNAEQADLQKLFLFMTRSISKYEHPIPTTLNHLGHPSRIIRAKVPTPPGMKMRTHQTRRSITTYKIPPTLTNQIPVHNYLTPHVLALLVITSDWRGTCSNPQASPRADGSIRKISAFSHDYDLVSDIIAPSLPRPIFPRILSPI